MEVLTLSIEPSPVSYGVLKDITGISPACTSSTNSTCCAKQELREIRNHRTAALLLVFPTCSISILASKLIERAQYGGQKAVQ